jgi:hypothetical protein
MDEGMADGCGGGTGAGAYFVFAMLMQGTPALQSLSVAFLAAHLRDLSILCCGGAGGGGGRLHVILLC